MIAYGNRARSGASSKSEQPISCEGGRKARPARQARKRPRGGWPLEVDGLAWKNAALAAEWHGINLSTLRGAIARGGGVCQGHAVRRLESLAEQCIRLEGDE